MGGGPQQNSLEWGGELSEGRRRETASKPEQASRASAKTTRAFRKYPHNIRIRTIFMSAIDDDDERAQRFAKNEDNKSIDALFIVAQHDRCKWADECRFVKDLCRATRAETGLWSAMARVGYGRKKRTLLMYEAYRGRLDRVQWLLARGAPRDARDVHGLTALHYSSYADAGPVDIVRAPADSSYAGPVDIVRTLLEAGADVNSVTDTGNTPLFTGIQKGRTDICSALIEAGAAVNVANIYDTTPLIAASLHGHARLCVWGRRVGLLRPICVWRRLGPNHWQRSSKP